MLGIVLALVIGLALGFRCGIWSVTVAIKRSEKLQRRIGEMADRR